MTADPPTEEDVLAMLLLWAARPPVRNVDNTVQWQERMAFDAGAVFLRATEDDGPRCEGPLNSNPLNGYRCTNPATDLQHAFGRGRGRRPESVRTCLAACRTCHGAEGRNNPSGAAWWSWFARFFEGLGYHVEADAALARARFEGVRSNLPASPRVR